MIYLIGLIAGSAMGFGYVLQQRVASHEAGSPPLSMTLLRRIVHRRQWWIGLLTMSGGQALGSIALGRSSLALVEPLLTVSLLVAFLVAAVLMRRWPTWQEVFGTVLLAGSLGIFLGVSTPRPSSGTRWTVEATVVGALSVAALGGALVATARRRNLAVESILLATAAGTLYGMQDVATRGTLLAFSAGGIAAAAGSPWPYLIAGSGLAGLILTQSAYRVGRLDYSLPPSAAAEPVVGILLGVGLLRDRLSTSPMALFVDAICGAGLVAAVVLIARSPALGAVTGHHRRHHHHHAQPTLIHRP
jgi:drug/metabolite transporter (DMT)-like permease